MNLGVALLGLAVLVQAATLNAQTLYKYVDKDGKIVYSDQPPKGVEATRVETDQNINVIRAPQRAQESAKSSVDPKIAARIALRDRLRAAVREAESRLAAAKEALANGLGPRDDEWQASMSRADNSGKPNAAGNITGRGGRVLCSKSKGADGVERVACPAIMLPSEQYHDRIKDLEEAVRHAEESLAAAQTEYRRNAPD